MALNSRLIKIESSMGVQTSVLMVLAAILSAGITLFQYYYKSKKMGRLPILLSVLRFLTLFGVCLILINPKFVKSEYRIEKSNLIVLVDNSTSVSTSIDTIQSIFKKLDNDVDVNNRFTSQHFGFGAKLISHKTGIADSVFTEQNTNIAAALKGLQEIFSDDNTAVVLLTDGNQNLGQEYGFYGKNQKFPVYPIAIGDTTRYDDLAISRVNANRYAFLKNKYPIEIYLNYLGKTEVRPELKISVDGKTVFRQKVLLDETDNSKTVNTLLNANTVGSKRIVVSIDALKNERNTSNNSRELAVEVIDEKTDIAIVSSMLHPDIGSIKKAIESNEQRSVSVIKPTGDTKQFDDVDLFILYQPNASFKNVYDYIANRKANILTVTGTQTDWNFLNRIQKRFSKKSYNQSEEIFPVLNAGFGLFDIEGFFIQDFPPLNSSLGEVKFGNSADVLLKQRIKGQDLNQPLLAVIADGSQREAVLFGENSWKWRMQSFRNEQNYTNFDNLIGKLVLYLTVNSARERLTLTYESVYSGSNMAKISATYFDETYIFDANASIDLKLKNKDSGANTEITMLVKGQYYEADLSGLPPGSYTFTVSVRGEKLSKSGSFTILDFYVEKQLVSTDYRKLERLAQNTGGKSYFPSQIESLLSDLAEDNRFVPVEKAEQNTVSLIDFRILLALIALTLSAEWFIRKYNGLV